MVINGREYPLAGVFPVTFGLSTRPQAHGYSTVFVEQSTPFYAQGLRFRGHEFRYSTVLEHDLAPESLCLRMERGTGFAFGRDGLRCNNVLALYTHVLAPATPQWAAGLLAAAQRFQAET